MSEENPVNNGEKAVVRNDKGQIVAGSAALNPAGKPIGTKHLSTKLYNALQDTTMVTGPDGIKTKKSYGDLLIQRIIKDSIEKGNTSLINMVMAYIDGAPQQGLDLTTGGEKLNTRNVEEIMEIAKGVSEQLRLKKTQ